jgi:hypothetical protein
VIGLGQTACPSPAPRTPEELLDLIGAKGHEVAEVKALMDEHARSIAPLQALATAAREPEQRVAELVNAAYGLTSKEVALMWRTAPPRMPGERP